MVESEHGEGASVEGVGVGREVPPREEQAAGLDEVCMGEEEDQEEACHKL